jgi:hypothetical protein
MAKQSLGDKKRRIVEGILGKPVMAAYVRGGWPVGVCEAWTDKRNAFWVDYRNKKLLGPSIVNGKFADNEFSPRTHTAVGVLIDFLGVDATVVES